MKQLFMALLTLAIMIATSLPAPAQRWGGWMPSGYHVWGSYREWPRGWQGVNPGYRYYGPGTYRPFSYWQRSPGYRY